jgi:hypothetical protein
MDHVMDPTHQQIDSPARILRDHFGVAPVCSGRLYRPACGDLPVRYQDLKYDVLARLPRGSDWSLTSDLVDAWVHGMRPAGR